MTVQAMLWGCAAGALSLAVAAAVAEHRRAGRQNLDSVGWIPWNAIQVLAAMTAAAAMAMALHLRG